MKLIMIAAIGKNNELGKNNNLIWRIPEDLKFFKETTTGHIVLSGRKTFASLPGLLPNRKHIILSKSLNDFPSEAEVFTSIEDFIEKYKDSEEKIFIIGGAQIYKQFIDLCHEMYLTEIDAEDKEADTFFPVFNKNDFIEHTLSKHETIIDQTTITYTHKKYTRK